MFCKAYTLLFNPVVEIPDIQLLLHSLYITPQMCKMHLLFTVDNACYNCLCTLHLNSDTFINILSHYYGFVLFSKPDHLLLSCRILTQNQNSVVKFHSTAMFYTILKPLSFPHNLSQFTSSN